MWNWGQSGAEFVLALVVFLLHIAVICRAITKPDRAPASRVAWVACIMLVPVLGILAYALLGETSIGRDRERRFRAAEEGLAEPEQAADAPASLDPTERSLFDLTRSINGFGPTAGNRVVLTAGSDAAIEDLVADIDRARATVHISFYIWLDDGNGGRVVDALVAAAARGVTCRVLVDALGSRAFIASPQWERMRDAGVHAVAALDDIPRLGHLAIGRIDLRNHRKIVVVDDEIAYCGSQNCADPAFRVKPRFAPWVDVFFRCEGPIVAQLQWLFLASWIAETDEAPPGDHVRSVDPVPDGTVVGAVFGTGPTQRPGAMSDEFVATVFASRRELTITTPYFVPDEPLLEAICAAPRRGVRTVLVIPAHNDSWFVANAARSTYSDLLEAGVELYEYPLGLLHSKTITVDGRIVLVGSANMDRRSLELNEENNLLAVDEGLAAAVRTRQQTYLNASNRVDPAAVAAWSFPRRLVQNGVSMIAPLL